VVQLLRRSLHRSDPLLFFSFFCFFISIVTATAVLFSNIKQFCFVFFLVAGDKFTNMRPLRLCAAYGHVSLPLPLLPTACRAARRLSPSHQVYTQLSAMALVVPVSVMMCGSRRYATVQPSAAAAAQPEKTTATSSHTTFVRVSTAAEAVAELQRWIVSFTAPSPSSFPAPPTTPPLVLSGKSLVLCVTALQLQEAQRSTASDEVSGVAAADQPVQQYLTALAHHVYTQCNATGKPRAAWQLFDDVEKSVLRAEALHMSVHYLQHHAFGSVPRQNHEKNGEEKEKEGAPSTAVVPPADFEARCAARDLELTFEAVEVLLAGRQIAEVHRAAVASEEVGLPSTTAAMVPPAEAAAFYIGTVVRLTQAPLMGCEGMQGCSGTHSPFLTLPPVKQQFWTQTAQQLTTVLYLALLITNTNTTDAQLVGQAFRDAVRRAYGVPKDSFGVVRSMHYIVTVALPYVARSLTTILDVVRAQQSQAAKEATAAAKARVSQRNSGETTMTQATKKAATPTFSMQGDGDQKGSSSGMSSDRLNKITLVLVCVAAVLYLASSNTELLVLPKSANSGAATKEASQSAELHETYQKLSAMAASATAPRRTADEEPNLLVSALQNK
jgi:hypothetical protein